jgi:hypothetical protein
MKLLNVGGCNKHIAIPAHFNGWDHLLLDIDPNPEVDVVCDARNMLTMPAGEYDAVYSSHFLEHLYRHDLPKVMAGFKHVMKDDGFIQIAVPNMQSVFDHLAKPGSDIDDVIYQSAVGPIRAIDMIYGLESFIENNGNDFMCHKNGFTPKSMARVLFENGFEHVFIGAGDFNVIAFVFKREPTEQQMIDLKLKPAPQKAPKTEMEMS